MEPLINLELLKQLPTLAFFIIAIAVMANLVKSQNTAIATMSSASNKSVIEYGNATIQTLKEAQDGQRLLFQSKVDDLFKELLGERQERKSEVERLQKRISDLECEVEEKDEKLKTQGERIETLEDENTKLKSEVERLKGALNGKQDKLKDRLKATEGKK